MFSWFIRNRKGSITIMISALLIAVLSMSSTLIEIAKYRSMERVFKEAEENAAFSVLSQYDRDLYEKLCGGFPALNRKMRVRRMSKGMQTEDVVTEGNDDTDK